MARSGAQGGAETDPYLVLNPSGVKLQRIMNPKSENALAALVGFHLTQVHIYLYEQGIFIRQRYSSTKDRTAYLIEIRGVN